MNPTRLRCIAVDDEPSARELIKDLLQKFCPDVELLALASNARQAVELIQQHQPNLLLLDLEMPQYNGFELLDMLGDTQAFCTVFITAYDQHALKAFRHKAVDYLVKPVAPADLIQAVGRAREVLAGRELKQTPSSNPTPDAAASLEKRLRVATPTGFQFVAIENIEAITANRAYADLTLTSGETIIVSQPLAKVMERVPSPPFMQIHRSYAINLHTVRAFDRTEGSELITFGERRYPLARARQESILKLLEQLP